MGRRSGAGRVRQGWGKRDAATMLGPRLARARDERRCDRGRLAGPRWRARWGRPGEEERASAEGPRLARARWGEEAARDGGGEAGRGVDAVEGRRREMRERRGAMRRGAMHAWGRRSRDAGEERRGAMWGGEGSDAGCAWSQRRSEMREGRGEERCGGRARCESNGGDKKG